MYGDLKKNGVPRSYLILFQVHDMLVHHKTTDTYGGTFGRYIFNYYWWDRGSRYIYDPNIGISNSMG